MGYLYGNQSEFLLVLVCSGLAQYPPYLDTLKE